VVRVSDGVGFVSDRRDGLLATSEVRWFGRGNPPPGSLEWFLGLGPRLEHRVDSYQSTAREEVGVKRRNGGPVEIKALERRDQLPTVFGLAAARIEDWLKWRVADDGRSADEDTGAWVDVDKTLLSVDRVAEGGEVACEVELAVIGIGHVAAWTFALEARGPVMERRLWLIETAVLLLDEAPPALPAALRDARAYPQWLARISSADLRLA
jgi:hypothetical protein